MTDKTDAAAAFLIFSLCAIAGFTVTLATFVGWFAIPLVFGIVCALLASAAIADYKEGEKDD